MSYYGIKSILIIYLTYFLRIQDSIAVILFHMHTVITYLAPLVGATIADSYWGKYKTIKITAFIYVIGTFINSISAIPYGDLYNDSQTKILNAVVHILALIIMASGTGGIKPCIASFGGDQFNIQTETGRKQQNFFFDTFYFLLSIASVLALLLAPYLRTSTCGVFGTEDSCYFLAFIIPAGFMCVAISLLIFGNYQNYYIKLPPSGNNILFEGIKCFWYGVTGKTPEIDQVDLSLEPKDHQEKYKNSGKLPWIYGAYGKVENWIIRDVYYVLKTCLLVLPLCIFWAGFDLQGSRWTLQLVRMDGYLFGDALHLLPAQANLVNIGLILILIPISNLVCFLINSCFGRNVCTNLRKVAVGMVFTIDGCRSG